MRHAPPPARAVRPSALASDACPSCGTTMRPRTAALPAVIQGESVEVPDVSHLHCPSCGEVVLDLDAAQALHAAAVVRYREREGLLGADEIRALRQQLGLTQAQLAGLLHLGLNTVSRWESGRNVQSAALDLLLKILRDVPGALGYLRDRAA